jgi:hypothetical protein
VLFPPVTKVVFAADKTGIIKARLRPGQAARDVRRGKAKKMSDNLIQYSNFWVKEPITLKNDEIVLLGTISRYTPKPGWLETSNPHIIHNVFRHNDFVVMSALPNLHKN